MNAIINKFINLKFPKSKRELAKKLAGGLSGSSVYYLKLKNPKKEFVVKIFPEQNIKRVREEEKILKYLANKRIRAQKVVYYNEKFLNGYGVLVTSYLEGKTLHSELKASNIGLLNNVAKELVQIHKLPKTKFWMSDNYPIEKSKDWLDHISEKINKIKDEKYKNYLKKEFIKIKQEKLNLVPLHGDFNPKNIIINHKKIGVIDFEIHRIGDLPFELGSFKNWFVFYGYKKYFNKFLEEYLKFNNLTKEEIKRIEFYYILKLVTTLKYAPEKNLRELKLILK